MKTIELNTGLFGLAFMRDGKLTFVMNAQGSQKEMEILLSDRIANCEAFSDEKVVEIWARLQWFFGNQTIGREAVPAHLYPVLPV